MLKSQQHENELLSSLGDAIRNRRVDIGMSQQELASEAELHRTYVTDVEGGRRNISMLTYKSLAEALRCALSLPMMEAERSMGRIFPSPLYGTKGGLSKTSQLLHKTSRFCIDLDIVTLELIVKANMSKLQAAVETFASKRNTYPRNENEVKEALHEDVPINPFARGPELPSMGGVLDEELATRTQCFLRPGEIEYSPLNNGANYIIRGGGANGQGLSGPSLDSTYVLSGNLRSNNQP